MLADGQWDETREDRMQMENRTWKRAMIWCGLLCMAFLCIMADGSAGAGAAGLPKKLDMAFASGAGGWMTELVLEKNGKFKGNYHDSDMGVTGKGYTSGTVYYSSFSGRFGQIEKAGVGRYTMKLEKLEVEDEPGRTKIADQIRWISSDPYGVESGKKFVLYCPGYRISRLPEAAREWLLMAAWVKPGDTVLEGYVLFNRKTGYAFYGN